MYDCLEAPRFFFFVAFHKLGNISTVTGGNTPTEEPFQLMSHTEEEL